MRLEARAAGAAALAVIVPLAAAGCGFFGSDGGPPRALAPSGRLQVGPASQIAAPHVVGDRVYGLPGSRGPQRLAGTVNAAFTGILVPAAVASADNAGIIVYHAFKGGRPVLRQFESGRRRDSVVATGAYSIAWRRDGALAYFKGLRPKVRDPSRHRGHLVVRRGGRTGRWTRRPGRYVAAAWAGDRLLAYRLSRLSGDVLAFDGPRRVRVLARSAFLVAISPDGTRVLVSRPDPAGASVRVVEVATGAAAAELSLRRETADGQQSTTFVAAGSWFGARVVGATNLGLVVFRVERSRIALEQTMTVDPQVLPTSLQEPRADRSGRRIVAWAELAAKPRQAVAEAALVECDRMTLHCRRGPSAPGLHPPRPIYNPSRP